MRFDRRLITHFEWLLPLLVLVVTAIGAATVYSATHTPGMRGFPPLAARQLMWLGAGVVAMLATLTVDYRRLERFTPLFYVAVLIGVLIVPVVGRIGGGSRRWITLGPLSVQPSEFMKLALVLVLARYFARAAGDRLGLRHLLVPLLLTLVPAVAVLAQPDLGTAVVMLIVSTTLLLLAGIRLRWFAGLAGGPAALVGLLYLAGAPVTRVGLWMWGHLKDYQQKRILTFFDPGSDPLGASYHVIQSKIAVGSGMLWGKGFLNGTQNHLSFLPEQHTDFIFSVFAEEWGFVGGIVLVVLYLLVVLRGLVVASRARDRFGALLVLGVTATVFWQAVINISMTTGLMPVVGIPLPFFSYGGSSLLCLLLGVGLVMNVSMRRYFFKTG